MIATKLPSIINKNKTNKHHFLKKKSIKRITLSLDIILWFFKSLHTYTGIRSLGPKLIMIRIMLIDNLLSYLLIILSFMFAFGVSTQALMYHNVPLNRKLLANVFFPAYWIIGGEYYTKDSILDGKIYYILLEVFRKKLFKSLFKYSFKL